MIKHTNFTSQVLNDLLADGSKRAFVIFSDYMQYLEPEWEGNFKYTKLNEKIMTTLFGFQFTNNHLMFKAYNRKVVQLVESGIADLIIKNHTLKPYQQPFSEPLKLTLDHLGVWFIILAVFCGFAALFFIAEVLVAKVQRSMKNKNTRVSKFEF
jgi:hypothetical protein